MVTHCNDYSLEHWTIIKLPVTWSSWHHTWCCLQYIIFGFNIIVKAFCKWVSHYPLMIQGMKANINPQYNKYIYLIVQTCMFVLWSKHVSYYYTRISSKYSVFRFLLTCFQLNSLYYRIKSVARMWWFVTDFQ